MENAQIVLELLSTSDSVRAGKIARDLNSHNSDRQEIEQQIKEQAVRMVRQGKSLAHGIVVWDESFHTGVIGIVAQRLVEEFYRPSAVLGADGDECFKGSMRSIKGVSAIELLGRLKQYLIKFGGHEGAAGFSLKRDQITDFAAAFAEISWELMGKQEPVAYIEADAEAKLGDVSVELVKEIQALAPFGVGNPQPTLLFKNLKVLSVSELKGAHLKIALSDGERMMSGLMWRTISHPALKVGAIVDVAARPDTNTYGGMTGLQLTLQAVQVGSASNRP